MATTVMFRLLLAVCCSVVCSAWLFKKGGGIQLADYRNCFCKAVNNLNYADIRSDFGSIQRCRGFPICGCRRSAMMTCGTQCDRKVKEWVCHHNCGGNPGVSGVQVRAYFTASTCHSNTAHTVYQCGSQMNCAF
ncbi:uncharacterized protein LOC124282640 [Haliotis rubra]|uniref:uncharacterized protein LOC124282640 n=1 Tax=Haliotis rubra TaxID=36100 RepID=UPI001EE5863B|nr:uncharacterized protein LOC124282640 [Haliotis rubra]